MKKEAAEEKNRQSNGPYYRRKKNSFFQIAPCPVCGYRARYTDFLPISLKKKKKCDKCGSELRYSVGGKTLILAFIIFLAAFGGSMLSMYIFENVWYMVLTTFLIVFALSFLLPLTMQTECLKKNKR